MKIYETPQFLKAYKRVPLRIKKKYRKQIGFLVKDPSHPSLRTKRKRGTKDTWEARVNYHYRFLFRKENDVLEILVIGPHDEGLGRK